MEPPMSFDQFPKERGLHSTQSIFSAPTPLVEVIWGNETRLIFAEERL
jgi:hypothetical protein